MPRATIETVSPAEQLLVAMMAAAEPSAPCAGCGRTVHPGDAVPAFGDSVLLCWGCAWWWQFSAGANDDPLHTGCCDWVERGH